MLPNLHRFLYSKAVARIGTVLRGLRTAYLGQWQSLLSPHTTINLQNPSLGTCIGLESQDPKPYTLDQGPKSHNLDPGKIFIHIPGTSTGLGHCAEHAVQVPGSSAALPVPAVHGECGRQHRPQARPCKVCFRA